MKGGWTWSPEILAAMAKAKAAVAAMKREYDAMKAKAAWAAEQAQALWDACPW